MGGSLLPTVASKLAPTGAICIVGAISTLGGSSIVGAISTLGGSSIVGGSLLPTAVSPFVALPAPFVGSG